MKTAIKDADFVTIVTSTNYDLQTNYFNIDSVESAVRDMFGINPHAYIKSNITGFMNILEGCRNHSVKSPSYASSSFVYRLSFSVPYKIYGLGNNAPVSLMDFVETMKKALGKKAKKICFPFGLGMLCRPTRIQQV